MPWTGLLLLVTNCYLLCHSSPVNVSQHLIDQLLGELNILDSEEGNDDVLNRVISLGSEEGEVPEEQDGIPKIPGLEKVNGQLYFEGKKVKSITPITPIPDVNDDNNDDEDDNDSDVDDDVTPNRVPHDDDGLIYPDVGWQDEDNTEVT